jgi:hypothetical protein
MKSTICKTCHKGFTDKTELLNHVQKEHPPGPPPLDNAALATPAAAAAAGSEKAFPCETCAKVFATKVGFELLSFEM